MADGSSFLLHKNSRGDDESKYRALVVRADSQEIHAVRNEPEEKDAAEGTDDSSPPAEQWGPADDDRSDGTQFVPGPHVRKSRIENAGENHGAGTNDYTVERVQSNLDPPNRHAGQARRFFVASYGEAVSSKQRPLEKEMSRNQYGQKYIDWARHAEQIAKPKDIEK